MRFLLALLLLVLTFPAYAETAIERINRTKTLRCGYIPYEPFLIRDANSGALSGVVIDYVNQAAKEKGLDVDWSEVPIDQAIPALASKRIDAYCVPCTPSTDWDAKLEFPAPFGALPYFVYGPAASNLTADDMEEAHFAIVDGFALTDITKEIFPKASYASLPQTASTAEMYDQLRFGKVDAHVNEHISAANYMKNNPDTIKRLSDKPVIVMQMFLLSEKGDTPMASFMKDTFDTGNAANDARLKTLLDTYDIPEGAFWLSDQCKDPSLTDKGWKVCDPGQPAAAVNPSLPSKE